jgi:DnaJ-class molecular chaperone
MGTIKTKIECKCNDCGGTGYKQWKHRESQNHSSGSTTLCPACNGTGKIIKYRWLE